MSLKIKDYINSLRLFLTHSGKNVLFFSLFYSLCLIELCFIRQDFGLSSFEGRMIGIASLQGFDVGARVSFFYTCIGLFLLGFSALLVLALFLHKKFSAFLSSVEFRIINYVSLAGVFFYLFRVFQFEIGYSMKLVFQIQLLMLGTLLLRILFFKKLRPGLYDYTLLFILSFSFYFFVADIFSLSGQIHTPDFFISITFLFFILILLTNRLYKKEKDSSASKRLNIIAYTLVPTALLPFISILKDEIFFILKARGIILASPLLIFVCLISILSFVVILRNKALEKRTSVSQKTLVARYYLPILIFSFVSYSGYSHYVRYSGEIFEAANKYLAVMEFNLFGVIPTLEKFNSHLLSDYFFSGLYTFLNGLQGAEMELYDFLNLSLSYVLYYYLFLFISRNVFVSLFFLLLFPLSASLMPEQYAFGILGIFALHKFLSHTQNFKNYLSFFLLIFFMLLWRIDIGYAGILTVIVLLFYYRIMSESFKVSRKNFFKTLALLAGGALFLLLLISYYRNFNLIDKLTNALNYITSAQTYGYSSIGSFESGSVKLQYFVFPILVCLLIIGLIIQFKKLNVSHPQRLAYLSFLYICVYYLINFNRGLIRHSLVEQVDHFTSTFVFLILPGALFVFNSPKGHTSRFLIFTSLVFFLLINYKLPAPAGSKSYFEKLLIKTDTLQYTDLRTVSTRALQDTSSKTNGSASFIDFITKNTNGEETFIDFSNNPMLYFYTKKITPSYFYQNPMCSHNDFLQNLFISELKNYQTPYLLFSMNDNLGSDIVDNVPNSLRHYKMAEYFYQNFQPYIVCGEYHVWKRNGVPDKNKKDTLYSYKKNPASEMPLKIAFPCKKGKKYFARVELFKKDSIPLSIYINGSKVTPYKEFVEDTLAYVNFESSEGNCHLELNCNQIYNYQIIECDFLPDFYSEKYPSFDFMKLPYIWGKYDKKLPAEPVLFESGITSAIDKTTGNTVNVFCINNGQTVQRLSLWFGNQKEPKKTLVSFEVLPTGKEECYAIRASSIYKWYAENMDQIGITTEAGPELRITKVQITKGL